MDNNNNSNTNNATKNTMDLAMSELARIHLIAANEALMKGDATAAFSQMNLAYLQLSLLEMKDMGRMNETQMMKFMQSGPERSSSASSSSDSKMMVPENCIIIHGAFCNVAIFLLEVTPWQSRSSGIGVVGSMRFTHM
jgi:hypothetical protein